MKKVLLFAIFSLVFSNVAFASSDCDTRCQILKEQWNIYYNKLRYCDKLPYYQATMCRLAAAHFKP
ncbi:hypothetical protein [Campylobacter estrildidarum]|uniref:Uncharacterized protein n=1 Tax=Campylobacter estrildidarum TaxID=2510189 RepID=A0A4U7BS19_9BACT|nr:hypothetical protein [Campylobacter estrildidarum]TKX31534.1 hypothetical protein CQA69_02640 [Campylobacter estrildidarum]